MKTHIQKEDSCVFCREIQGSKKTNFARLYPEFNSRRILESGDLFIMPCIGQLVENHCLLLPKQHYNTIADVALDHHKDMLYLLNNFERNHIKQGEKLLVFEHGAKDSCSGGCGIYHAHLHILSIPEEIEATKIFSGKGTIKSASISDSFSALSGVENYILFGNETDGFYSIKLSSQIESQFLRKRLATFFNQSEWDWRNYSRQQSVINMISAS